MKNIIILIFLMISAGAYAQAPQSNLLVNIHEANTSQINALNNLEKGMLIFNTDSTELFFYDGTNWVNTIQFTDTSSLSTRITNNQLQISLDYDLDSTNELITSMIYVNDTLKITENNTSFQSEIIQGNWPDASKISLSGFHYAMNAMDNNDTVVITDNGSIGIGVSNPTERIEVDGSMKLRNVNDASVGQDTVLVIGSDGVVKKRTLQFCDSVKTVIEVTNTASGNINANITGTIFSWINPAVSTIIQNSPGAYSVSTTGITVNKTGIYKVTVYQYQVGTTGARNNAALRLRINGVVQPVYGASGYQRRASGHDESTASLSKLLNLNSGDVVSLRNDGMASLGSVTCPAGTLVFILEEK